VPPARVDHFGAEMGAEVLGEAMVPTVEPARLRVRFDEPAG
jgi:hypothetical protein